MKTYYSLESARDALTKVSNDEYLTLKQAIGTAESLIEYKINYFYGEEEDESGDRYAEEIYNLIKHVDCMADEPYFALEGVDIMVACGGPNVWVKIDNCDNVVVECYWGDSVRLALRNIGLKLDEVRNIYSYLIDR